MFNLFELPTELVIQILTDDVILSKDGVLSLINLSMSCKNTLCKNNYDYSDYEDINIDNFIIEILEKNRIVLPTIIQLDRFSSKNKILEWLYLTTKKKFECKCQINNTIERYSCYNCCQLLCSKCDDTDSCIFCEDKIYCDCCTKICKDCNKKVCIDDADDFVECSFCDNTLCDECIYIFCNNCDNFGCEDCVENFEQCKDCEFTVCDSCSSDNLTTCNICDGTLCNKCIYIFCDNCENFGCEDCVENFEQCKDCEFTACDSCSSDHLTTCNICDGTICFNKCCNFCEKCDIYYCNECEHICN